MEIAPEERLEAVADLLRGAMAAANGSTALCLRGALAPSTTPMASTMAALAAGADAATSEREASFLRAVLEAVEETASEALAVPLMRTATLALPPPAPAHSTAPVSAGAGGTMPRQRAGVGHQNPGGETLKDQLARLLPIDAAGPVAEMPTSGRMLATARERLLSVLVAKVAPRVPAPPRSFHIRRDDRPSKGRHRCFAALWAQAVIDDIARPIVVVACATYEETQRIVDGVVPVPFAVVDPARPDEPLALVERLDKPPFRWVERVTETTTKRGKVTRKVRRVKETVALVLVSKDGTWHRPLTTLELAILQSFPAKVDGKPLDFGVPDGARGRKADRAVTAQREVIGNAVPPKCAQGMAEQMLLSLMVATGATPSLGTFGSAIWVRNVRALEKQLRAEGFVVVKGTKPLNFTAGTVLDDGAVAWRKRGAKPRRTWRVSGVPTGAMRVPATTEGLLQ